MKQKEKVVLPQEGDIVTWKQNPELIVKARLGQRREHIPDQFDREFYRPEREHYVGQFPIDYVPENFAPISKEEADKLPLPYSNHQLEFSLMLNGAKGRTTDGFNHDDKNQVKVKVQALTLAMIADGTTTKNAFKEMLDSPHHKYIVPETLFYKYGLNCYYNDPEGSRYRCFGKASNTQVSGVFLTIPTEKSGFPDESSFEREISADYYEPVMGGVWIQWRTQPNNWSQWREIDAAIWRLLSIWNAEPKKINAVKKTDCGYKKGDTVVWKVTPQLIIKTKINQVIGLGYSAGDRFFLGQFPLNYSVEKNSLENTDRIEDVSSLEFPLEFNLLMSKDKEIPVKGWYGGDYPGLVKVRISNIYNMDASKFYTPRKRIDYLLGLNGFLKKESKFEYFGLECYRQDQYTTCIGQTKNTERPDIFLQLSNSPNGFGSSVVESFTNTKMYGGIRVEWKVPAESLKDWRKIDAEIWRLLEMWNVHTKNKIISTISKSNSCRF